MQVQAINNNQASFGARFVSIRKNDKINVEKLKVLTFVVRNRRGYQSDLHKFGIDEVSSLKTVGFINTGHTLKSETYSVTNLGDQYYKDLFGIKNYYTQRIIGFVNKLFK